MAPAPVDLVQTDSADSAFSAHWLDRLGSLTADTETAWAILAAIVGSLLWVVCRVIGGRSFGQQQRGYITTTTTKGALMYIGGSVLLIALGAILAFAVQDAISGVDLVAVGYILMIAGAIGIVASFAINGQRQRRDLPPRTDLPPR